MRDDYLNENKSLDDNNEMINNNKNHGRLIHILSIIVQVIPILLIITLSLYSITLLLNTTNPILVAEGISMRPSIVAGDILILDRPEFSLIREGDIIAYRSITTNSIVVHRVVDVNAQGYLVTKGDNSSSNSIDEIVYMDNYLGRVVHIIPKVGIIILLAKNPLVLIIIAVSITLASLFILLDKRHGFKDRSIRIDR